MVTSLQLNIVRVEQAVTKTKDTQVKKSGKLSQVTRNDGNKCNNINK